MHQAENAWRRVLGDHTLADILVSMTREVPPEAVAKGAAWFQEAVS
jgi:hypothetical protein